MGKIGDYINDALITGSDKLLGTDAADGSTKNFTVSGLETFLAGNGNLATLTTAQTLTNKTIDFSSNTIQNNTASVVSYDPSASTLVATNVQAALDEIDADLTTVESSTSTNAADIISNADSIIANAGDIATNASNISSLNTGKKDVVTPGTTLVADFNLSSLTADEYVVNDGGASINFSVDDAATALIGSFENRWIHAIVSGSGINVAGVGAQTVLGTTTISSTGSYRITNIDTNTWMVS